MNIMQRLLFVFENADYSKSATKLELFPSNMPSLHTFNVGLVDIAVMHLAFFPSSIIYILSTLWLFEVCFHLLH